jgi:hypothetical protein
LTVNAVVASPGDNGGKRELRLLVDDLVQLAEALQVRPVQRKLETSSKLKKG